jgi:hypothetical protein
MKKGSTARFLEVPMITFIFTPETQYFTKVQLKFHQNIPYNKQENNIYEMTRKFYTLFMKFKLTVNDIF